MAGRITHDFTQFANNPRSSRNVPVPPSDVHITYRYKDSLSDTLHTIVLTHDTSDLQQRLALLLDHFRTTTAFLSVVHKYAE